jgi:hypothetical protein
MLRHNDYTMNSGDAKTRKYQEVIQKLQAELRDYQYRSTLMSNSRGNVLASANMCLIAIADDLTVKSQRNASAILGDIPNGRHIKDVIPTKEAISYFEGFKQLSEKLPSLAAGVPSGGWNHVYPLKNDLSAGFTNWHSLPSASWRTTLEKAELSEEGSAGEFYLVSARELIMPEHDFRIEYKAISQSKTPCDLSVVTGSGIPEKETSIDMFRPDQTGYCFALGAINNQGTMIQRNGEIIATTRVMCIEPGWEHHITAERLGGVLRLVIDGTEACRVVDCLPLMSKGLGHVGLYTCADRQVFRDLKVWTRPSCLSGETLQLMDQLRRQKLRLPGNPPRFIEPTYLYKGRFLLKNITEIVEQREQLKDRQRQADKLETLLHLAGGAAHELNQPLTVLAGYLDLILSYPPRHETTPVSREELDALKDATNKISGIVRKIGSIRRYKTKTYVDKVQMLDIDGSASDTGSKKREKKKGRPSKKKTGG